MFKVGILRSYDLPVVQLIALWGIIYSNDKMLEVIECSLVVSDVRI